MRSLVVATAAASSMIYFTLINFFDFFKEVYANQVRNTINFEGGAKLLSVCFLFDTISSLPY